MRNQKTGTGKWRNNGWKLIASFITIGNYEIYNVMRVFSSGDFRDMSRPSCKIVTVHSV